MNVRLLEFEEWVPCHTRLFELFLLVLLVYPAVHPKAQGSHVEIKIYAYCTLGCRHEELMNGIVGCGILRIASNSEF